MKTPLKPIFKLFRRTTFLIGLAITLASWLFLTFLVIWAIGAWHNYQRGNTPLAWGMIWSNKQARLMGLDIQTDLDAILSEIPFKHVQLTSYWDEIEATAGIYDFQSLDQQFAIIKGRNLKITLQIGLHQARFPYCHQPTWTKNLNESHLKSELKNYIEAVIEHFDGEIHLIGYHLEPEIYEAETENCSGKLDQQDLKDLYRITKDLTDKDITISRRNNLPLWRGQDPKPDIFGLKLEPYPDKSGRWQYTLPTHYYSFSAGNTLILHKDTEVSIRELSIEPKVLSTQTTSALLNDIDIELEPEVLEKRLDYGRRTNIRMIDLKGLEWAWAQKEAGDERFWRIILENVESDF